MKKSFEFNGSQVHFEAPDNLNSDRFIITADKCGCTFDIGEILEPYSENPCLKLNGPIGVDLVMAIIEELRVSA
jgi:hypothetical protein